MATPAIGDVWELSTEFESNGEKAMCVYHLKVTTPVSGSDESMGTSIVVEANSIWQGYRTTYLGDDAQIVCHGARKITPNEYRQLIEFDGNSGGSVSPAVPAQCAVIVSKYTAESGPRGRGRAFVPFLAQEFHESGQILDSAKNGLLTALESVFNSTWSLLSGDELEPVLWSRVDMAAKVIDALVLRPVLGNQRRRVDPHQGFHV